MCLPLPLPYSNLFFYFYIDVEYNIGRKAVASLSFHSRNDLCGYDKIAAFFFATDNNSLSLSFFLSTLSVYANIGRHSLIENLFEFLASTSIYRHVNNLAIDFLSTRHVGIVGGTWLPAEFDIRHSTNVSFLRVPSYQQLPKKGQIETLVTIIGVVSLMMATFVFLSLSRHICHFSFSSLFFVSIWKVEVQVRSLPLHNYTTTHAIINIHTVDISDVSRPVATK